MNNIEHKLHSYLDTQENEVWYARTVVLRDNILYVSIWETLMFKPLIMVKLLEDGFNGYVVKFNPLNNWRSV